MLEIYNMEDIRKSLDTSMIYIENNPDLIKYEDPETIKIYDVYKRTGVKDLDGYFKNYVNSSTFTVKHRDFVRCLCAFRDHFIKNNQPHKVKVVDYLIGNSRLFRKMVFINDGSYRMNRIWFHIFNAKKLLDIDLMYELYSNSANSGDWISSANEIDAVYSERSIRMLNMMFRNYEKVFVMIPKHRFTSDDPIRVMIDDYFRHNSFTNNFDIITDIDDCI